MVKLGSEHYLEEKLYFEAQETFNILVGTVLFELARYKLNKKDIIISNFIARANMITKAVYKLYGINDYQDCWILYRCLLDRLFHLYHLHDKNEFEVFEDWSFLEQYKAMNRLINHPQFDESKYKNIINQFVARKERGEYLLKNPPKWRRPKAKEIANKLNMDFLYMFGYDYGSTHVHPMANDGI